MDGAWKDLSQEAVGILRATRVLRSHSPRDRVALSLGSSSPEWPGNPLYALQGTGVQNNTRSVKNWVTLAMRPCVASVTVGLGTYFGPRAPTTGISGGGGLGAARPANT